MKRKARKFTAISLAVAMFASSFSGTGLSVHAEENSDNTTETTETVSGNETIEDTEVDNSGSSISDTTCEEPTSEVTDEEPTSEVTSEEPVSEVSDENTDLTQYIIKVVDAYYDSEGQELGTEVRCEDTYDAGAEYSYSALELGYEVLSESTYNGVADSDKTLTFEYLYKEPEIMLTGLDDVSDFSLTNGGVVHLQIVDENQNPLKGAKVNGQVTNSNGVADIAINVDISDWSDFTDATDLPANSNGSPCIGVKYGIDVLSEFMLTVEYEGVTFCYNDAQFYMRGNAYFYEDKTVSVDPCDYLNFSVSRGTDSNKIARFVSNTAIDSNFSSVMELHVGDSYYINITNKYVDEDGNSIVPDETTKLTWKDFETRSVEWDTFDTLYENYVCIDAQVTSGNGQTGYVGATWKAIYDNGQQYSYYPNTPEAYSYSGQRNYSVYKEVNAVVTYTFHQFTPVKAHFYAIFDGDAANAQYIGTEDYQAYSYKARSLTQNLSDDDPNKFVFSPISIPNYDGYEFDGKFGTSWNYHTSDTISYWTVDYMLADSSSAYTDEAEVLQYYGIGQEHYFYFCYSQSKVTVSIYDVYGGTSTCRETNTYLSNSGTLEFDPISITDYQIDSISVIADGVDISDTFASTGEISFDASNYSEVSITYNYKTVSNAECTVNISDIYGTQTIEREEQKCTGEVEFEPIETYPYKYAKSYVVADGVDVTLEVTDSNGKISLDASDYSELYITYYYKYAGDSVSTTVNEYFWTGGSVSDAELISSGTVDWDTPYTLKSTITYNGEEKEVEYMRAPIVFRNAEKDYSISSEAKYSSISNCLYYSNISETAGEMINAAFSYLKQNWTFDNVEIAVYYKEVVDSDVCTIEVYDEYDGVSHFRESNSYDKQNMNCNYSPLSITDYQMASYTVIADGLDITSLVANGYGNLGDVSITPLDYNKVTITYTYRSSKHTITVMDDYYIYDSVAQKEVFDHSETRTVDTYSDGGSYEYDSLYPSDIENTLDWRLAGGDFVDVNSGKAKGTIYEDRTIRFKYTKVLYGVTMTVYDEVVAPYADSSLPLNERSSYGWVREDVANHTYEGDFTFTSYEGWNCLGGMVFLLDGDSKVKLCDATEVSDGVYEVNFHLDDCQGVYVYFYYSRGGIIYNGDGIAPEWYTDITVIDEYVNSDTVTRENVHIEDYEEMLTSRAYMPASEKEGYDYNNNLTVTATLEDGTTAIVNDWFEEADAESGSVKFIPDYFDAVTITYQYAKEGDITPDPVEKQYSLIVNDHFGSDVVRRVSTVVSEGTAYSYTSLVKEGWRATGTTSLNGVVTKDTVLDFYYEPVNDNTPEPEVKNFTITVNDHFGDIIEVREQKTVAEGTEYSYKALSRDGWKVTGEKAYNGVVTEDTVLDFYYKEVKIPVPPTPDPEPIVPEPTPVVTSEVPSTPVLDEEPKTGDKTTSIPFILSALGLLGAVVYKKRKENE